MKPSSQQQTGNPASTVNVPVGHRRCGTPMIIRYRSDDPGPGALITEAAPCQVPVPSTSPGLIPVVLNAASPELPREQLIETPNVGYLSVNRRR